MFNIFTQPLLAAVPEGRVFGLDFQTIVSVIMQIFNASVLAAGLSFLLYRPVGAFMKKRRDKIADQLSFAADESEKANALKAQYEKRLEDIDIERAAILDEAHKLAEEKAMELLHEARMEAHAMKERAKADILREQEQARDLLKLYIIEVSTVMAEKIVANAVADRDEQDRLFAGALAELEGADWLK